MVDSYWLIFKRLLLAQSYVMVDSYWLIFKRLLFAQAYVMVDSNWLIFKRMSLVAGDVEVAELGVLLLELTHPLALPNKHQIGHR